MAPLTQTLSSNLSLPPNSYVYKILSTSPRNDPFLYSQTDTLAVISSDDSLRLLDPRTLNVLPDGVVKNVNESVTCLERADDPASNLLATAGRDGTIKFWDKRSKKRGLVVQSPEKLVSALVCNSPRNFLAAGIENPNDGPNSSPVYIWDLRNATSPQLALPDSHTDTITSLSLHPALPTLLLTSSTDGLLNVFDTSKPDEEDALYQVVNHGSAVAHAGFMFPSTDMYALGTDETASFHALQSEAEDQVEPQPKIWGDVRDGLGCEYLVDLFWVGDEPFLAAGSHSSQHLDLIPVQKPPTGPPLQYTFDLEKSIRLPGAHGEEIVRDVFTDVHSHTTFTAGEDGHVRAWKFADAEGMDVDDGEGDDSNEDAEPAAGKRIKDKKERRREKKKEKRKSEAAAEEAKKTRYKPY